MVDIIGLKKHRSDSGWMLIQVKVNVTEGWYKCILIDLFINS